MIGLSNHKTRRDLGTGMNLARRRRWFADAAGEGGATPPAPPPADPGAGDATPPGEETPQDFEAWFKAQAAPTQALINTRFERLEGALKSEREGRKGLEKQLKAAASKAEEGSELRQQLDALNVQLEQEGTRADFYEEGLKQGVADLRLAWLAYSADAGQYSRRGRIDWDALKTDHPSLFATQTVPRGNAGAGTGTQTPTRGMNEAIRAAAGRQVR